ncbi:FMN-binding protein [Nocardioides sp.]|uniref:FMN-binding protein n=1 Tax=Nocardioides sp. TaxID=35761 RepID=UPI0037843A72
MKRIVLWFLSTVSVLVLLFGYHTSTSGPAVTASPPAAISSSGHGSGGSSSGGGSGGGSGGSGGSSDGSAQGSQPTSSRTVTGSVAQTQWGPVQVEVTLSGSTITHVSVPQYPNSNGQDIEIANYALPILIQETMDQQSANIDMVSGATYTSAGYIQSLQSALDQAGM